LSIKKNITSENKFKIKKKGRFLQKEVEKLLEILVFKIKE